MTTRNELAADTIHGVYPCENAAAEQNGCTVLEEMDFYEALGSDFAGTIYGNVSDELAERIADEYGIR